MVKKFAAYIEKQNMWFLYEI